MAEERVSIELFSQQFPANREKYREFIHFWAPIRETSLLTRHVDWGYRWRVVKPNREYLLNIREYFSLIRFKNRSV